MSDNNNNTNDQKNDPQKDELLHDKKCPLYPLPRNVPAPHLKLYFDNTIEPSTSHQNVSRQLFPDGPNSTRDANNNNNQSVNLQLHLVSVDTELGQKFYKLYLPTNVEFSQANTLSEIPDSEAALLLESSSNSQQATLYPYNLSFNEYEYYCELKSFERRYLRITEMAFGCTCSELHSNIWMRTLGLEENWQVDYYSTLKRIYLLPLYRIIMPDTEDATTTTTTTAPGVQSPSYTGATVTNSTNRSQSVNKHNLSSGSPSSSVLSNNSSFDNASNCNINKASIYQNETALSSRQMPPIHNRNYQEARYKTELCLHFRERNTCPHGERCLFAHGLGELRPYRGRHPKHKTQLCKSFHEQGFCNYGYRCSYIHLESPRTIRYIKSLNAYAQRVRRERKQQVIRSNDSVRTQTRNEQIFDRSIEDNGSAQTFATDDSGAPISPQCLSSGGQDICSPQQHSESQQPNENNNQNFPSGQDQDDPNYNYEH